MSAVEERFQAMLAKRKKEKIEVVKFFPNKIIFLL